MKQVSKFLPYILLGLSIPTGEKSDIIISIVCIVTFVIYDLYRFLKHQVHINNLEDSNSALQDKVNALETLNDKLYRLLDEQYNRNSHLYEDYKVLADKHEKLLKEYLNYVNSSSKFLDSTINNTERSIELVNTIKDNLPHLFLNLDESKIDNDE